MKYKRYRNKRVWNDHFRYSRWKNDTIL